MKTTRTHLRPPSLQRITHRLIIRPLKAGDFTAWKSAWINAPSSRGKFDHAQSPSFEITRSAFLGMLRRQKKNRRADHFFDFAIFERKTGAFIGSTALMDVSREVFQNAYIGYWIFNTHWGKGLAKEAVNATIDIAFHDLLLLRIEAGIDPGNRRSLHLARALGMRREGRSARRLFLKGEWRDMMIYALTSEERGVRWEPQ